MSDTRYDKYELHLECSGLEPEALVVLGMTGQEEISRPFAFELDVSPRDGVAFLIEEWEEIMAGTATMSFGPDREHPVHGVIRRISMLPTVDASDVAYRFTLVPKLWHASLTRGSWIYLDQTVPEIITKALSEILPDDTKLTDGEQFELSVNGTYEPREYVVQYEESVLDFISRQAEHWGIYYFFDHLGEEGRVIFGDTNQSFPQLEGFETIQCRHVENADPLEVIRDISVTNRMVPHQVSLRDYNYRTPAIELVSPPQEVDANGLGDVHVSGDHFWTPAEGSDLAFIRSQEMFQHKLRMIAESRVRGLRAGHRFTLAGGTPEELGLARDYLVVRVEHEYGGSRGNGAHDGLPYRNRLTLQPYEVAYRPDRVTPKPRIYGIIHAKIDSEVADDGKSAPLDDWGRYKVVMPWDVAGEAGGKSSCWIRFCQASGGGGFGFSTQLMEGLEVAIYHIDGDPDRPVIAGNLPNFEKPPVVTRENSHRSVIKMRGGMTMTFSD